MTDAAELDTTDLDGAVVRFRFMQHYQYVAVFAADRWYFSAGSQVTLWNPRTHEDFMSMLARDKEISDIEVSTGWKPIIRDLV